MTDDEANNTTKVEQTRREASLISRRFLRQRLKEAAKGRVNLDALEAAEAWFEDQFEKLIAVAIRERERETKSRSAQAVRFRTPPLKRVHLAPFIDPPAEPPRGAVSSIGPQEVEVGRTDTPEAVPT
ncbi:MAG TPA: hypothetical protein VGB18_07385 [Candidatus Thermoplasmatota archaeon]